MKKKNDVVYKMNCEYASQSEDMRFVPLGYINKTVCGCGLTTLALESPENCIITVPTIELVRNKVAQYPNERYGHSVFGVYGRVSRAEMLDYIERCRREGCFYKIITTYDSLRKCEDFIEGAHLIIDESDMIIREAWMKSSFFPSNVKIDEYYSRLLKIKPEEDENILLYLLRVAEQHKDNVSFISSTPLPVEYLPEWVGKLDQVRFEWLNTVSVHPILFKNSNPVAAMEQAVIKPLRDNSGPAVIRDNDGNTVASFSKAIIFMNSVAHIITACKNMQLPKEDVAIICGDSLRNSIKIRGYNRLEDPRKLPKFTFVTSSGFQGIDLFDKDAMNVVVSISNRHAVRNFTLINLMYDLRQATSRQRDKKNPNFNKYLLFYNQNNFSISDEELEDIKARTIKLVEDGNSVLNEFREKQDERYASSAMLFYTGELFHRYSAWNVASQEWRRNDLLIRGDYEFIRQTRDQYKKGFKLTSMINSDEGADRAEPIEIKFVIERRKSDVSYYQIYRKSAAFFADYEKLHGRGFDFDSSFEEYYAIFSEEELASENFKVIDECLKAFHKMYLDKSTAQRILRSRWSGRPLHVIEVQSRFKAGNSYTKDYVKKTLSETVNEDGYKPRLEHLSECGIKYREKTTNGRRLIEIVSIGEPG